MKRIFCLHFQARNGRLRVNNISSIWSQELKTCVILRLIWQHQVHEVLLFKQIRFYIDITYIHQQWSICGPSRNNSNQSLTVDTTARKCIFQSEQVLKRTKRLYLPILRCFSTLKQSQKSRDNVSRWYNSMVTRGQIPSIVCNEFRPLRAAEIRLQGLILYI